jgi:hypothetical protein
VKRGGFDLVDCKHGYITTTQKEVNAKEKKLFVSGPARLVRTDPRRKEGVGAGLWGLSIGLGNTFEFVFLLDSVRVGRALSCVD